VTTVENARVGEVEFVITTANEYEKDASLWQCRLRMLKNLHG